MEYLKQFEMNEIGLFNEHVKLSLGILLNHFHVDI
jgi:hypothetical protein